MALFQPNSAIASAAVALAGAVGWSARIVREEKPELDIEVDGRLLRFNNYRVAYQPLDGRSFALEDGRQPLPRKIPAPCEVAVRAFLSAIPCSRGHATILAPVGSYGCPQAAGAIDSVILFPDNGCNDEGDPVWTADLLTISHTRCWLISLLATCEGVLDAAGAKQSMQDCQRLLLLPSWMNVEDTATLCEIMRDLGWPDARFPQVVVLASRVLGQAAGSILQVWLAATDACVCVALAEDIGAVAAPHLSGRQRFRLLSDAWRPLSRSTWP